MAEMLDLESLASPAASRDEIVARLRRHEQEIRDHGVTGLFLFGSALRNELRPDSDVDVYVEYDPDGDLDYFGLCRLERFLGQVVQRQIDLTTRDGLHPVLRDGIVRSSLRVV